MSINNADTLVRTYRELMGSIPLAMSRRGMFQLPSKRDVGLRFVHSVTDMPTLVIFMSNRAHDRDGWYKIFEEIMKSGVYTVTNYFTTPYDAGASCENNHYKVAICTLEEKDILIKNGWANGNVIVSTPDMDKAAALKGIVRAWLVSLIK